MPKTNTPTPSDIHANATLGHLVTQWAFASRVLQRHGLDFCCNGQETLASACARRDLALEPLLAELRAELEPIEAEARWDEQSTQTLVQHILERYHAGHREEMPRLLAMADKVEAVHAGHPSCPRGLAAHLRHVAQELESHMLKEEQVLFPMLLGGHAPMNVLAPIHVMQAEHDEHGRNLDRLRALAADFVPPADACNTWRSLFLGLEEFEREVMEHIHLENHLLFPRFGG